MIQSNIPKQCILAQNVCDFWSYPFLESRRCVGSGNDSRRNRSVKDHTPIYFYAYADFSQCFRNSIKKLVFSLTIVNKNGSVLMQIDKFSIF